jgi:hypothetical protein
MAYWDEFTRPSMHLSRFKRRCFLAHARSFLLAQTKRTVCSGAKLPVPKLDRYGAVLQSPPALKYLACGGAHHSPRDVYNETGNYECGNTGR